jgi:hypothetical protein
MSLSVRTFVLSFIYRCVYFTDAKKPNYGQGTLIAVPLLTKGAESGATWNAVLESSNENVIRVKVTDRCIAKCTGRGGHFFLLFNELGHQSVPVAEEPVQRSQWSDWATGWTTVPGLRYVWLE